MRNTAIVGRNVVIGNHCQLGHHVIIYDDTIVGDHVCIGDFSVVGRLPYRAKRSATAVAGDLPALKIADNVIMGSGVILYRGSQVGQDVLLADSCQLRENSRVDDETIVGRNVTIENQCVIGRRCKIETNAYITAFSTIADDCFIGPMVTFTNDAFLGRTQERHAKMAGPRLERGARIGANATILPGVTLHADCLVGAGAVVTRDVPEKTVVMGCPARVVGPVTAAQLLENQAKC